jgi:hypothetical protein
MPTRNASIDPTRIGYLRAAPGFRKSPVAPAFPAAKSMWSKLARDGLLISESGSKFARSETGEKALADFDQNLSEALRLVLNAVKDGASRAATMKGMATAVKAGLVRVRDSAPHYALTEAGLALADPIGEEGYFEKSGNLVFVHGLCTDKGYEGNLQVERLEGESKGKRMLIPRDAFVRVADWPGE